MVSIHAILLAVSLGALAMAGLAGRGSQHAQSSAERTNRLAQLILGGALAVGNAVCLLPDAPRWYSIGVAVLSVGALLCLLATGSMAGGRAAARRSPRHVPLYAINSPATEPRIIATLQAHVVDAGGLNDTSNVVSITRARPNQRAIVTQPMLHSQGPVASHSTVGHGTYVAARLGDYLPDGSTRRGRGDFRARAHQAPTSGSAAKRMRVLRAYGASGDLRGRLSEHRS